MLLPSLHFLHLPELPLKFITLLVQTVELQESGISFLLLNFKLLIKVFRRDGQEHCLVANLRCFLKGLLVAQLLVVFKSLHVVNFADVLVKLVGLSLGLVLWHHLLKVAAMDDSINEVLVFIRLFSNYLYVVFRDVVLHNVASNADIPGFHLPLRRAELLLQGLLLVLLHVLDVLQITLSLKLLFIDLLGRRILAHFVRGIKKLLIVLNLLQLLLKIIERLVFHFSSVLASLLNAIALQLISFPKVCS